ncbi:MAG: PQQ-binding-like beta-propeller repeat protein [Planctomycetota bacterium]
MTDSSPHSPYMPPSTTPANAESRGIERPPRRSWPGIGLWIIWTLCAAGILGGHWLFGGFDRAIPNIITLIMAFIASVSFLVWFSVSSAAPQALRIAVPLAVVASVAALVGALRIEETSGTLVPTFRFRWQPRRDESLPPVAAAATDGIDLVTTTPDDFPRFLGPAGVPVLVEPSVPLAGDWSTNPPQLRWKRPIGAGWSAFAVVNGYAVTMEQRGPEELVTCYDVRNGEPVWSHAEGTRHETILGGIGPRGTPTIHRGKVYALGAHGLIRCLDGATGKLLWKFDLFAATNNSPEKDITGVAWGRSASPLIIDETVVVPMGGPPGGPYVTLAAFQLDTGELVWKTGKRQVSYASPVLTELAGQRQIVSVNESSVTGHDPANGRELWEIDWPGHSGSNASTSQPNVIAGRQLLLTKGYGVGAALFEFAAPAAGETAGNIADDTAEKHPAKVAVGGGIRELWRSNRVLRTKFTSVAIHDGHAYGLNDGILECVSLSDGKSRWKKRGFEHGQTLIVGDRLLVLGEFGEAAWIEATPDEYRERGRIQAIDGKTWNTVCLAGRLLLVRNSQEAACWELTATRQP